jgi:hypothetical protein
VDDRAFSVEQWRFVDVISGPGSDMTIDYRFMAGAPFVEAVTFRFKRYLYIQKYDPTLKNWVEVVELRKTEVKTPDQTHEDPWVWRTKYVTGGGKAKLTVDILVGSTAKWQDEILLFTPIGTSPNGVIKRDPPRLVRDINDSPRRSPGSGGWNELRKVKEVLARVDYSLKRGPDETAWLGPNSGRGLALNELGLSTAEAAEEAWARRVSEMMLAVRYELPATIYGASESKIWDRMADQLSTNNESFYPVVAQCQQLSTVVLMTHGVPRNLLGGGVNAGGSNALPVFKPAAGGHWHTSADMLKADKALQAKPPVAACSLYEFHKTPNKPNAHIGLIIRVHDGSWHVLQSFDTGGLRAKDRGQGVTFATPAGGLLGSGIFDDPWVTAVTGSGDPFTGVGVIAKSHKPPANLDRWWPCGFTRLIIRRRSDNELLYATPLLRMHDSVRDYPISVLGNSLRGCPCAEEFDIRWQVSAPRVDLSKNAMTLPRGATVAQIVAPANVSPDHPLKDNVKHLYLLSDLILEADEKVRRANLPVDPTYNATPADKLPWGIRSGSYAKSNQVGKADVPPYLRGDELL